MAKSALEHQEGGDHYKKMAIQPVEFIHKNGIGFIEGSVIKYVSRWRIKGGIEDLRKARHFLDLLIEMEDGAAKVLAALCLLLALAVPIPAHAGEDAYYDMSFPDLVTAPADARIHTHACLTGTVDKTRKEGDGDIHVNLCQVGRCVILEIIPELPVARPRKGQRIHACGIVRFDGWHRWWELHPLLTWTVAP